MNAMFDIIRTTIIPHLTSLRIARYDNMPGPRLEPFPYASLSHLQELEIAQMITVEATLVGALLAFPHLRKLELSMKLDLPAGAEEGFFPGFVALRDLHITGTPDHLSRFLDVTVPPRLESLALTVLDWFPITEEAAIAHLHAGIAHLARAPTPRFALQFDALCQPIPSIIDVLAPAMLLAHLTHVAVRIERLELALPVTHADLGAIAIAWPRLVELELSVASTGDEEDVLDVLDAPTAQVLACFAERHPDLVRLTLPFVDLAMDFPELASVPVLDHGLKTLRVSIIEGEPAPRLRAFAMLIDRLFPNLDLAEVQYPCDGRHIPGEDRRMENWCEVEQMLLALQTGRTGAHRSQRPMLDSLERGLYQ